MRAQNEHGDESVAVTRREADQARGGDADDRDDHATDQYVHVYLAALAQSAKENRQLRRQRDDAHPDALAEVQPECRAIEPEALVEERVDQPREADEADEGQRADRHASSQCLLPLAVNEQSREAATRSGLDALTVLGVRRVQ